MSSRSSASDWTKTSSRHGGSSKYRDCRLPRSKAVKSLIWLAGQDPRKVTGLRQYQTTYSDDDLDIRSNVSSLWSSASWSSSGTVTEYYFLESRGRYVFDDGWDSDGAPPRRRKAKKKGGKKPMKGGGKHYESSSEESDSDSDSSASSVGADEYGAGRGAAPGFPPAGMMPGMMPGRMHGGHQPPGQFGYGAPPQASFSPRSMGGFPPPPPPPGPPGGAAMPMSAFGGPFGRPGV